MNFFPMELPARSQFRAIVAANIPLCRDHFRLILRLPQFPDTYPGQFVQISCRDLSKEENCDREIEWKDGEFPRATGRELTSPLALLRRPFSIAGRRDFESAVELDIIHRIVGVGTDWLAKLNPGEKVFLLGPLGNRFSLPSNDGPAILVGGGVGIPPMLYLAEKLAGRSAVAFCGALTRDLLPLTIIDEPKINDDKIVPALQIGEFAGHHIPSVITTDDGSFGYRGFVTQALEKYLDQLNASNSTASKPTLYTCGPEPMMKRVADIAQRRGLACQIAVERAMACGMGTCQSCVIKLTAAGRKDARIWVYKLACTDGPVFHAADLLW